MNLKDLYYFYDLSNLQSFTEVARKNGVSQPSISYAIKRLEKEFHCQLLVHDPSHRTFKLTPQGDILLRHVKKALPENLRHAIDDIGERAMYKFQHIYDKIAPKQWQKLALAYTGNTVARGLASAMSEGAEEGVQYLNSKEDFAKKYGWNAPSIGDIIANDFIQGSRVAKAYLSVLGLADSELKDDKEFWSNVKGGFSMGFMNPMGMVLPGNIRGAYR